MFPLLSRFDAGQRLRQDPRWLQRILQDQQHHDADGSRLHLSKSRTKLCQHGSLPHVGLHTYPDPRSILVFQGLQRPREIQRHLLHSFLLHPSRSRRDPEEFNQTGRKNRRLLSLRFRSSLLLDRIFHVATHVEEIRKNRKQHLAERQTVDRLRKNEE
jgi:hypothetical protein